MTIDTMIGVDLAKSVFQLHASSFSGEIKFRKKLSRTQFRRFMEKLPSSLVVMEACGSAHYWSREMVRFGHEVKLIAPRYVKPFVKRQKNDAADAEAIVVAAQRPEMRFVEPKTEDQQARAMLFRLRDQLVHQRTELINALRAHLYEFGHTAPQGVAQVGRFERLITDPDANLPDLVRRLAGEFLKSIYEKTRQIDEKTLEIKKMAQDAQLMKRLQTMPGIGPMTALAVDAFAPSMETFKCGRDFAAWLGLVPKQYSSGGKERLGRISKAGQSDIRRLLIIGAMSRLHKRGRNAVPDGSWLARMLERKPRLLVAIALANKMARMIWAMLTKGEDYQNPMPSGAAL